MSHRIIIDAVAEPNTTAVAVNVVFTPPHDMNEKEVGEKVTSLLRQVKRMQETVPPHEHAG